MNPEAFQLHWLWLQTDAQLDMLTRRAAEGIGVDEAVNFARWIMRSELCEVLRPHATDGDWKVNAALLKWKAEELQRICCAQYAKGIQPNTRDSALDAINHKLDVLAAHVAVIHREPPLPLNNIVDLSQRISA